MAFDQPKLLLVANVITITAVTALSLMWLLRKKDQQKLIGALSVGREPARQRPEIQVAPPPPSDPGLDATPGPQKVEEVVNLRPMVNLIVNRPNAGQSPGQGPAPTPVALPEMDRDIRQFVIRRAQAWSAPSVSQWNKRLNADQPGLRRVAGDGDPIELPLPQPEQVIFPSQLPSPASLHRLAAPIQLCRNATAAQYGNLFYSKESQGNCLPGSH